MSVLRPACLSDWYEGTLPARQVHTPEDFIHQSLRFKAIQELYRAEWKKRGFQETP